MVVWKKEEILESAFSGVAKMLSGKKFPHNFRSLRLLTEELLRETIKSNVEIQSMDALVDHPDLLCEKSRTSTFLMMKFVRAEREGDFPLHLKVVEEAIPYFFSAGHINYARYGTRYFHQMKALPSEVR